MKTQDTRHKTQNRRAGFTLIELMVSVSLFAVVMLVSVGSLMSLISANRKARALESVMNNLNVAVDSMVRSIRMGSRFACDSENVPDGATDADDCANISLATNDGQLFSFAPFGSDVNEQTERWVYSFVEQDGRGQLWRSRDGGNTAVAITAPEVDIEDIRFYTIGTRRGPRDATHDLVQPKVVIVIKGVAGGVGTKTETPFYIQATAVQRIIDL